MGVIWRSMLHCTMARQCLFLDPGWPFIRAIKTDRGGIAKGRFRQTSPVRFNVGPISPNNPLGRPAASQRHRSLCQRGGFFGDHAQCLRLGLRSTCKKLHHPQMNNLLCLDTKHCSVAGDLHPVREQRVPSADYLLLEGQSQPALFVPRSDGDAPI